MLFESKYPAGEGSPGDFRVAGEDHEYDDFVGETFPTAPPDLPSPISDDEIIILTQEKSIKAEQACASEKKSTKESEKRFRTHTNSKIPDDAEIIDLESIQPSTQRPCWDLTKEVTKAEVNDESFFTIKKEDAEEPFPWRDMGSEIIELLDSDDETAVFPYSDLSTMNSESTKVLDDETAVLPSNLFAMNSESTKAFGEETAVLPYSDLSTMDSKITKVQPKVSPFLSSAKRARQSPIDNAKVLEMQRKYIARVLEKSIPSSAGAVLKNCQPPPEQSATVGTEDQDAWMKANVDFDIDAAAMFVSPGFISTYTDSAEDLPTCRRLS